MGQLAQDLRFALRTMRRNPGVTTGAVFALALGIGATTALFSVVYAVILDPFPFGNAQRIVNLGMLDKGTPRGLFLNTRQFVDLQKSDVLDGAIARDVWPMTLTGADVPQEVVTQYFSANALMVLGVPPLLGRVLTEADGPPGHQPQRVVVLTHRFWKTHFGGRADAVGQSLQLNHETYSVIGVLPPQYFPTGVEIVVPIHMTLDPSFAWGIQARLRPGIDARTAELKLQPIFEQFARESPERFPREIRVQIRNLVEARRASDFVPTIFLIFTAAVLLLVQACANVSILLLARGTSRAREFVVRSAMGATRARLMAQLLVESLLLAAAGAVLGLTAAYWGIPAALAWLPVNSLPAASLADVPISLPVLLFSVILTIASTIVFGLWPAFSFSRATVSALAREGATRTVSGVHSRRIHHFLLAGQVALTVLLLSASGAAIRVLAGLYQTPLGYEPQNVLVTLVNLPEHRHTEWAGRAAFFGRLRDAVSRTPQVQSVTLSVYGGVPPRTGGRARIEIPGRDGAGLDSPVLQRIGPQYFSTLRIPLLEGRMWSDSENARAAHVAVVNQTMARRLWPNAPAVGQRLRVPEYIKSQSQFVLAAPGSDGWFEIVGVAGDTPNIGLHEPAAPALYVPYTLMLGDAVNMIVRTAGDPLAMDRSIREAVRAIDPSQPVNSVRTAETVLANAGWARERFVTLLLLGFAAFALALAMVGLYSVAAFSVSRRVKEFGIRMALGASRAKIVHTALAGATVAVGSGLAAGVALSVASNAVLSRWSIGNVSDPVVLSTICLALLLIAVGAAVLPANRAASIQPAEALRID